MDRLVRLVRDQDEFGGLVSLSSFAMLSVFDLFFFFFQAEDGIRDLTVTGVQTCALPIFVTLALSKLAPLKSASTRIVAHVGKCACRSAQLRSVRLKSARIRYAPVNLADLKFASVKLASCRSAPEKFDSLRVALDKFAPCRSAPTKEAALSFN